MDSTGRNRSDGSMPIPGPSSALAGPATPFLPASSTQSTYFDQTRPGHGHVMAVVSNSPILRESSGSSSHSLHSAPIPPPPRPGSSGRRYEPYGPTSPRLSASGAIQLHMTSNPSHGRRQSQPQTIPASPGTYYSQLQQYDIKPNLSTSAGSSHSYHPPSTAPGSFAQFYSHPPPQHPSSVPNQYHQPHYTATTWSQPTPPPIPASRLHSGPDLEAEQAPREYYHLPNPPSSSGSSGSNGNGAVSEGWANQVSPNQAWDTGLVSSSLYSSGGATGIGSGQGSHNGEWRGGNLA